MTRHNPIVRFQHMLDHAKEALEMIKGKSRSDLESNRQLELSLVRLVEIIGEAAGKLQKEDHLRFPEIPWAEIISLRNRLIHGYDVIDYDIFWQILNQDIPVIIPLLEKALLTLKTQA